MCTHGLWPEASRCTQAEHACSCSKVSKIACLQLLKRRRSGLEVRDDQAFLHRKEIDQPGLQKPSGAQLVSHREAPEPVKMKGDTSCSCVGSAEAGTGVPKACGGGLLAQPASRGVLEIKTEFRGQTRRPCSAPASVSLRFASCKAFPELSSP